jgi:hypothetical protein
MTRPPTPNPAAAPLPAPHPHPLPEGVAAVPLPRFIAYVVMEENGRHEVTWVCRACGQFGAIDGPSRVCRRCWRFVVLLPAALAGRAG